MSTIAPARLPAPGAWPNVTLRRLTAADRPTMIAHLLALDAAERASRFHALRGDEAIAFYVESLDFARVIAIGALTTGCAPLVGLAEAHLDDPGMPQSAEISVSVLSAWHGRGLGRRLVASALAAAFGRGAECAEFALTPDNQAMARLVRSLGGTVDAARGRAWLNARSSLAA